MRATSARRRDLLQLAALVVVVLGAAELVARLVTLRQFYAPLRRHPALLERYRSTPPLDLPDGDDDPSGDEGDEPSPGEAGGAAGGGGYDPARAEAAVASRPWLARGEPGRPPRLLTFADITPRDFRSYPSDLALPPGAVRVVFAGSSTTLEGYPEAAAELFDRAFGKGRVQVVNLSADGAGDHAIDYLMSRFLRPLQPAIVVFYEGFNDVEAVMMHKVLRVQRRAGGPASPVRALSLCRLRPTRGLWSLAADAAGLALPSCRDLVADTALAAAPPGGGGAFDTATFYRRHVALARQAGAQPYLSTFAAPDYEQLPAFDRDYLETEIAYLFPFLANTRVYAAMLADNNRRIREVAAELGVPVIDVASGLRGGLDLFQDNCHRTPAGLARHAQIAFDALRPAVEALLAAPVGAASAPGPDGPPVLPATGSRP